MSGIHEEHTRAHYVTKCRAGLAKRFVDDLQAASSLHTDVGVYVVVRPDRSSRGHEDETVVAEARLKPMVGSGGEPELTCCRARYRLSGVRSAVAMRDRRH